MLGACLVESDLSHEDVTCGQTSTEKDPDYVGLPAKYGQDSGETCQPVLATEMEAQGEEDHCRGHLVSVGEEAGHVEDQYQGHVDTAPL